MSRGDGDRGGAGGRTGAERGGDRRGRPEPTGALADALRRAGFGTPAGGGKDSATATAKDGGRADKDGGKNSSKGAGKSAWDQGWSRRP